MVSPKWFAHNAPRDASSKRTSLVCRSVRFRRVPESAGKRRKVPESAGKRRKTPENAGCGIFKMH